ncbi:uncharacterized protein LOC144919080 [Branchiostoma floridae x Branchiostoma belcheri]
MRGAVPSALCVCLATVAMATPAPFTCPRGHVWNSVVSDCMSCDVCEHSPATSICGSCPGAVTHENPKVEDQRANDPVYICPPGFEWEPVLSDCLTCDVCASAPDTSICNKCSAKQGLSAGVIAGISVSSVIALMLAVSLAVYAWKGYKERQVGFPIQTTDRDMEGQALNRHGFGPPRPAYV